MSAIGSGVEHERKSGQAKNSPAAQPEGELAHDPTVDDFFTRLKYDMRRPKPGQEAIAAALQAIQRLAIEAESEESVSAAAEVDGGTARTCRACGSRNRDEHRFCAACGVPLLDAPPEESEVSSAEPKSKSTVQAPGQHYYHHHYHHHYFSAADRISQAVGLDSRAANNTAAGRDAVRLRAPQSGPSLSRAEAAVRKVTQDWALACNTKQLDDLVELYATDAIVLRPNVPPVRGTAAIREFFCAVLDAGLGEVELDPLRVEVFGDMAYEAGRCKMLVPAMGKRREERGKYLVVLNRQAGGEWKVIADCWSSDLSLGISVEPATKSNAPSPGSPLPRPPRKV